VYGGVATLLGAVAEHVFEHRGAVPGISVAVDRAVTLGMIVAARYLAHPSPN
jgi:hypothetical protein